MASPKGSDTSALRAWLIVLASLIDDALVLALVFLGLWYFHVRITWVVILAVALGMAGFIFVVHRAVVPALRRRLVFGRDEMIGTSGRVTRSLEPLGMVRIGGEYWQARSVEGKIECGEDIEVVGVKGLELEVKKKHRE